MMMPFAGEGWGEGMSRMVIDDEMWSRLEKLLPKPKGRHGEDDRLFMEAIGACVGGLSTKIHAKVDSFGHLVNILITPGQVHESQVADDVWAHEYCECFLADKAYDIDSFRQALTEDGIKPVIPSKKNRLNPTTHDRHIYKERNIVERFFQKIKRFRRIATRYDKTARMYLTGVIFVSILLALK